MLMKQPCSPCQCTRHLNGKQDTVPRNLLATNHPYHHRCKLLMSTIRDHRIGCKKSYSDDIDHSKLSADDT